MSELERMNKAGARYAAECAEDIKDLSYHIKAAMYKLLEDDGGVTGGCITEAIKTVLGNIELINYTTNFMIKNKDDVYNEQQKNKEV